MKNLILLTFLCAASTALFGQTLSGKITNENRLALAGATITNLSDGNHSHSAKDGSYELANVSIGDTIQFVQLNYQAQTFVVSDLDNPLNIQLDELEVFLDEIAITNQKNILELISDVDLKVNPVNSSQEILRKVPGLFIGQHAGGGKAEQIFLRGFDIDHGTDIRITVDDMPVNMVSHAHGQGYSDLHFLIPETVNKVDFAKGTYDASQGNFATAGHVNFKTKDRLDHSTIRLELGQYQTGRLLGMFKLLDQEKHSLYVASEYQGSQGVFESPQHFNRLNVFAKYQGLVSNTDKIKLTASHFRSSWDASGQIPTRAVESGLISRFGAIDDTEGGNTSRTNVLLNYDKIIDETSIIKNSLYYINYGFELYSNFTFFLEDPVNGDQIRQKENRDIYGLRSEYNKFFNFGQLDLKLVAGVEVRNDISKDNELSRSLNRTQTLEQIQLGEVNETNLAAFVGTKFAIGKFAFHPAVRVDYFDYTYHNFLTTTHDKQSLGRAVVSPKFNFSYHHSNKLELYAKAGRGFHSNDTRVIVQQTGLEIIPAAYGFDLGYHWKPRRNMFINVAYWFLYMEQEFVYVGDAGIVEPSGRTRRHGVDLSYRYQPIKGLFWNVDATYTHARAIDENAGENYIPLAADLTLSSGINYRHKIGIYAGMYLRYMKDRPANEDNSIVAEGYAVVDMNLGYQWKNFDFGVQIQNLFNTEWNEAQFATESRLFNEVESVEELHFTPGTPFFIKGSIEYNF